MARRNNNGRINGLYGGDARGLYGSSSYGRRNTMIYGKPKKRWPKFLLLVLVIAVIAICLIMFACGKGPFAKHEEETQEVEQTQEVTEPAKTGVSGSFTITAMGDCTLGTDENFNASTSFNAYYDGDTSYYLQRITGFTASDDLTICNFEGTLTESTDRQDKQFAFKGPAEYAQILVDGGVNAANLANNHSYDYGEQSYEDTKVTLTQYGITNFGYDRTAVYETNGIKVGLFGVNGLSGLETATSQMQADVKGLQEQGCEVIIGCMHGGVEGDYVPSSEQVSLAHAAIDAGCDLMLGTHPHVMQGIEKYNGRYILYSLGNFCFGGNDSPMDFSTFMWQQTFTVEDGELVMDEDTLKDVCVIPCRISTTSTSTNDYQPCPLSGDAATEVLNKLNDCSSQLSSGGVQFSTTVDDTDRAKLS